MTSTHDQTKVFLSYSRRDRERASLVSDLLRQHDVDVFRDTDDILPTEEWRERLEQLIAEADTIVFLLSPASAISEVCAWEVDLAARLGKRIAPLVIEEVEPTAIPAALRRLNFIFATSRDPFENAIASLISALNTDVDWIREHTRLGMLSARWDASGRPARLLLRGGDIADAERWRDGRPKEAPSPTALHLAWIAESRRAVGRRLRGWIAGSLTAAVAAGSLALFAYFQSVEAERQRIAAEMQRNAAETARADAERRKTEAERARAGALRKQSLYLSGLSEEASARGDHLLAMALAVEGAPAPPDFADRPMVSGVRTALRRSLSENNVLAVLAPGDGGLAAAAYSADGALIATASGGEDIRIWDVETGREVAVITSPGDEIRAISFSPDGQRLATASYGLNARIWNIEENRLVRELVGHEWALTDVSFSPDGRWLATASQDQTARVWDVETGEALHRFASDGGYVMSASFSPDGSRLVTASSEGIGEIWYLVSDAPPIVLSGHQDLLYSAEFSPDGEHVITASADDTTGMFYANTGDLRLFLRGHDNDVLSASYSSSGEYVVTASADGTARTWFYGVWTLSDILVGHSGSVTTAAFSPDGARVLTAGGGRARVWDVSASSTGDDRDQRSDADDPALIVEARETVSRLRPLSQDERRRYFLEEDDGRQ